MQALDAAQAGALALRFVAGQHWFADAPMLVVLAARVRRNFWKYRNHPKAYRAIVLDAGHLSQTFRSEEHTSELQSLMRTSYAVFCLPKIKPLTLPIKYETTHSTKESH